MAAAQTARPAAYPASHYSKVVDVESQLESESLGLAEATVRAGFVRKVFGLLSAQLLLTVAVAGPIVASSSVRGFMISGGGAGLTMLAMLASLVLLMVLTFSESARHSHPTNLVLLAAFTACEGVVVGAITAQYNMAAIVLAVGCTAAISVGLTLYALNTRRDFTLQGGLLFSCLMALVLTGFMAAFLRTPLAHVLLGGAGAALFGAYLVYDVQLIVGGKHASVQLSSDEYVVAAIQVYLDLINLFLHLLRIISELTRER